nr:hypothetical protein [uncultured Moellerella sp.]
MSNDIYDVTPKLNFKSSVMTFEQKMLLLNNQKAPETDIGGSIVKSGDVINDGNNEGVLEASLAEDNGFGRGAVIGGVTKNIGLNVHHMKSGNVINTDTGLNQGILQGGNTINEHTNKFRMHSGDVQNSGYNTSKMQGGNSHNKGYNNNELIASNLYNNGNNQKDGIIKGENAIRNLQKGFSSYTKSHEIIAQQEINKTKNKIERLKEELIAKEKELKLKQEQFKRENESAILNSSDLNKVKIDFTNVSKKLSDVESQLNEKNKEVDKLTNDIHDKKLEIKKLNDSLGNNNDEINLLKINLENERKKIKEINEKLKQCEDKENNVLGQIPALLAVEPNYFSSIELTRERELQQKLQQELLQQELLEIRAEKAELEKQLSSAKKDRNFYKKAQEDFDVLREKHIQTLNNLRETQDSLRDIRITTSKAEQTITNTLNLKSADETLDSTADDIRNLKLNSGSEKSSFAGMNDRSKMIHRADIVQGGGLSNSGINNGTVKGGDTVNIKTETSLTNNNNLVLRPELISAEVVEQLTSSSSGLRVEHHAFAEGQKFLSNVSLEANALLSSLQNRQL